MLGARGVSVSPDALRSKVYIPTKEGSLTTELIARARRYGKLVYPLSPTLSDVLKEISAGNPVLVLQNLGLNWLPRWHFSVVTGYDLQKKKIKLRSGKQLIYEVDLKLFEKTWRRANSWAIVIVEPHQIPRTAQETRFFQSANDLELVGQNSPALEAYKTLIKRWPTSSLSYFGAGNTSYALGEFSHANKFFNAYIEQQPQSPSGWNNLAYSLLKQGCYKEASTAIYSGP